MVSSFGRSAAPRSWRVRVRCLLTVSALVASSAGASVFLSRDDALRLAFGDGAKIERTTVFLTDDQIELARALAGAHVEIEHALVTRWIATKWSMWN